MMVPNPFLNANFQGLKGVRKPIMITECPENNQLGWVIQDD